MKIAIIDNYDSFTFNLYQMLQPLTDERIQVFRNDAIDFAQLQALGLAKIVLSPGPGHPSLESDFGICKEIILRQAELGVQILGVCLGHQGIVHHFGGDVVRAPQVVHGKTSKIRIEHETKILAGLAQNFEAMRYHSLVAAEEHFPDVLRVTARDAEHGLIMALEHKTKPIYGVQFHPESIGTPEGSRLLRNFVEAC